MSDNFIKDPTKGIANTGQMNYLKKQANKQTNKPSPPEQLMVETTRRDPNSVLCQAVNTLCNVLDIFYMRVMGMSTGLESASSGHKWNYSSFGISALASFSDVEVAGWVLIQLWCNLAENNNMQSMHFFSSILVQSILLRQYCVFVLHWNSSNVLSWELAFILHHLNPWIFFHAFLHLQTFVSILKRTKRNLQ